MEDYSLNFFFLEKLPMDNYDNYLGTISFIVGNGYSLCSNNIINIKMYLY